MRPSATCFVHHAKDNYNNIKKMIEKIRHTENKEVEMFRKISKTIL